MLDWLSVVRVADIEAVRWALSGLGATAERGPVTRRVAQRWVARMMQSELLGRFRPEFNGPSVVWPAHDPVSRPPVLYRQTARHEITVAQVSARYLARGYGWTRDRRPGGFTDHQADGVGIAPDGSVELVEVEFTAKSSTRYRAICNDHAERLTTGGIARVVYLCTPEAAKTVMKEADRYLFRDLRPRLVVIPLLDARGAWIGADDAPWVEHLMAPAPTVSAPGLWDAGIA